MKTSIIEFTTYKKSVFEAFDAINASKVLSMQKNILIKPNLVNSLPHPVTTDVKCCEAVIQYIQQCSGSSIAIGEGCGEMSLETDEIFDLLGYKKMAQKYKVDLVDLNYADVKKVENKSLKIFPKMYLPKIAFTHYIISVPVLKAHSLSEITGTLKNMIGFAPPKYYSGQFGMWKKAVFHNNVHQSILDLTSYIKPNLTLMDASIGLADYHLGGAECSPNVNKLIAGFDPFEVDRISAKLLDLDINDIPHLL